MRKVTSPFRKIMLYGAGVMLVLSALYLAGFIVFILFVTRTTHQTTAPLPKTFDIVVFTGGKDRVKTALILLEKNPSSQLLISGVDSKTGLHQLLYSADSLALPTELRSHITLGHRALSTAGNAQETADWVAHNHSHTLLIVTSAYHMPRALAELHRTGPDLQLIPYRVQSPDNDRFYTMTGLKILCREYMKFTGAVLRNVL
ncbi:YdcF family protein [Acetobacteraceae bacterium ESL0709]|nr:YdcF family protein [Acetobacteraceae bacterium ESL0697]MDF7678564.1 YdcF family protein [Acetobacteraceae bacterium ESL0709]